MTEERWWDSSAVRFLVVASLLAVAAVFLGARDRAEIIPRAEPLSAFPQRIGEWVGLDQPIAPDIRKVLGPGDFLSRVYSRDPEAPPIALFLAYFPSQRTGDTIHSPKNCLPGSGWMPVQVGRITVPGSNRRPMTINRYVVAKDGAQALVFYWYQAHNRVTPSEYWAKWYLISDSIRLDRSDGGLVRVVAVPAPGEDLHSTQARAVGFIEQLVPLLDSYIPR